MGQEAGGKMKRNTGALEAIKQSIAELKGKDVELHINRGRKKFETFMAVIDCIYPSVFTVKALNDAKQLPIQTFSYFDVMCGDVVIKNDKL